MNPGHCISLPAYASESVEERYAVQRANQTGSLRNDVYDTGPEVINEIFVTINILPIFSVALCQ